MTGASQGGGQDVADLIGFLASPKSELREMSVDLVQGLTGSSDGIEMLLQQRTQLFEPLLRLLADPAASVSRAAATSLVNLSQDKRGVTELLERDAVARVMTHIREMSCPHHDMLCMLLANITIEEEGCEAILQTGDERLAGLFVAVLLRLFVDSLGQTVDLYEHVALVLCNVTRIRSAREVLLQKGRGLMHALTPQLTATSELRRRGCAAAIKNLCMGAEAEGTLAAVLEEKQNIGRILARLDAGEDREQDDTVREALADAIQALSLTAEGRDVLMAVSANEVLRAGYAVEKNKEVAAAMESAAEGLMRHGDMQAAVQQFATGKLVTSD
ncbi:unnamed protein product [Pedinophyceae sp. YPF-701]|nr:unnamed protein product [Pedinophyceae sp. YPF-701]